MFNVSDLYGHILAVDKRNRHFVIEFCQIISNVIDTVYVFENYQKIKVQMVFVEVHSDEFRSGRIMSQNVHDIFLDSASVIPLHCGLTN